MLQSITFIISDLFARTGEYANSILHTQSKKAETSSIDLKYSNVYIT